MGRKLKKKGRKGPDHKRQFVRDCYSSHASRRALERISEDLESVGVFKSPDRIVSAIRSLILEKQFEIVQKQPCQHARTAKLMLGRRVLCVVYKGRRLFPVWDLEFKTIVTFIPAEDPRVLAWLEKKFSDCTGWKQRQ